MSAIFLKNSCPCPRCEKFSCPRPCPRFHQMPLNVPKFVMSVSASVSTDLWFIVKKNSKNPKKLKSNGEIRIISLISPYPDFPIFSDFWRLSILHSPCPLACGGTWNVKIIESFQVKLKTGIRKSNRYQASSRRRRPRRPRFAHSVFSFWNSWF